MIYKEKVTNVYNSTLIIGRFKLTPGDSLPSVELSSAEVAGIEDFIKKGYLKKEAGKPTPKKTEPKVDPELAKVEPEVKVEEPETTTSNKKSKKKNKKEKDNS